MTVAYFPDMFENRYLDSVKVCMEMVMDMNRPQTEREAG